MRFLLFTLIWIPCLSLAQSGERIESEYKLNVPLNKSNELWTYLSGETFLNDFGKENKLNLEISEEDFIDIYFDNDIEELFLQEVGLRHRSRYKNDSLLKKLIQLKTPIEQGGDVARNEIKYEVKRSVDKNDFFARHDFLKYVKKRDREDINYQLNKFGVKAQEVGETHTLMQNRKRVYIHDVKGALATLTLDRVGNSSFPFQKYTELELELNEVRYTEADSIEKSQMETFNTQIKEKLKNRFPFLEEDQTPKYNKMKNLIDQSFLSTCYKYRMWIILFGLVLFAIYVWIRNENR